MKLKGSWNKILSIFSLIWIFNSLWKLTQKVHSFFYNGKRYFFLSEILHNRECSSFTKLKKISNGSNTALCQWTNLSLIESSLPYPIRSKGLIFQAIWNFISEFMSTISTPLCPSVTNSAHSSCLLNLPSLKFSASKWHANLFLWISEPFNYIKKVILYL